MYVFEYSLDVHRPLLNYLVLCRCNNQIIALFQGIIFSPAQSDTNGIVPLNGVAAILEKYLIRNT